MPRPLHWATALLLAAIASAPALAQRSPIARVNPLPPDVTPRVQPMQCGNFTGHFGPLDYRTAHMDDKRIVEGHHFDTELRLFLSGRVAGRLRTGTDVIGHGFVYTLKSFPNHPVALMVIEQLGRRLKSEQPQNIEFPLECFYLRGMQIAPDDPVVRGLYGVYLAYRNRPTEALANLKMAEEELAGSGPLQYQLGLAYFELKQYERAQMCAMRAERRGFAFQGLQNSLREAKAWNDKLTLPVDAPAAAASEASAPAPVAAASGPAPSSP